MTEQEQRAMQEYRHNTLVKKHRQLNKMAIKGQLVFAGSSLMEDFPINEMALTLPGRPVVYNRGIGGDTLDGFAARLDSAVLDLAPRKLFINIGTNDISAPDYVRENMLKKYRELHLKIQKALPDCTIYIMSYYPVNRTEAFKTEWFRARTNAEIDEVNERLRVMAGEIGMEFVNVTDCLRDDEGNLIKELSLDGMHMYPEGYARVFEILKHHMN